MTGSACGARVRPTACLANVSLSARVCRIPCAAVILASLIACGGPSGADGAGSEIDAHGGDTDPSLPVEASAAAEAALLSGIESIGADHRDDHDAMFVRNFPKVSAIDAPWLPAFVYSGAARSLASARLSELGLTSDDRSSAHALLLVGAWEAVNLTRATSTDANAVLRQLQGTGAPPEEPGTTAVYMLTAAVILEAATRAAHSGDAARRALGDQVRADFVSTTGIDLVGLRIDDAGFVRTPGGSGDPTDD